MPNLPDNKMWDSCQEAAANSVINLVSEFAPNFQKSIIAQKILSPLQLEQEFGLLGGDIFHGALDLNQIYQKKLISAFIYLYLYQNTINMKWDWLYFLSDNKSLCDF